MDYNNDGLQDILAGDSRGNVTVFLNVGTKQEPRLAAGKRVEADGKPITASRKVYKKTPEGRYVVDRVIVGSHKLAESYTKLHMADWDADGLDDLLVGHTTTVLFYKNAGTKSEPRFLAPVALKPPEGKFPTRPSPFVTDFDGDGRKDLLTGVERRQVLFYRNVGTAATPQLAKGAPLTLPGEEIAKSYRWFLHVADWNGDGKDDLLIGTFYSAKKPAGGNVWLFLRK